MPWPLFLRAGRAQRLSNAATGKTYWQADSLDAAGRATRQLFAGGSAAVNRVYNNRDRVELVDAGAAFQERYLYDSVGNLKTRNLKITAGTPYQYNENFSYDELNRLTKASGDNPVSTQDIVYDELGNITYKSGVGSYSYPASGPGVVRPHALTALKGVDGIERSFEYDANGNLVRNENRLASWTSYNLPKTLEGYGQREEYWYDAEHERIKQVSSKYGTQLYFNPGKGSGLFYEKTIGTDGKVEHKHYLTALGDVIGEVVKRDNPAAGQAAEEERYWVKDHLGSNRAILGSSGQLLESLGFDAWGKRRYASGQTDAANPGIAGQTTDRGYTGHEHLDELGLINMNARIYDPLLGRFLSPDPTVTYESNAQNYNRYSYVLNNVFYFTDGNGEEPTPVKAGNNFGGLFSSKPGVDFSELLRKNSASITRPLTDLEIRAQEISKYAKTLRAPPDVRMASSGWQMGKSVAQAVNLAIQVGVAEEAAAASVSAKVAPKVMQSNIAKQVASFQNQTHANYEALKDLMNDFFGAKKIKAIEMRVTQSSTRLREHPYDVGVEVEFTDGTKIDMDSSRVKETVLNQKSPTGVSPKKFSKDVAVSSDGKKRGLDEQEKSLMDKVKELLGL